MRGSVEGMTGQKSKRINEQLEGVGAALMRQEMSRVNKIILAWPDQSHVQLLPLLA